MSECACRQQFLVFPLSSESSVKGENCLEIFSRYSDRKVYEASVELHLMTKLFSVQSLQTGNLSRL